MESSLIRKDLERRTLDKAKEKERPKEQPKQEPSNFDRMLEQNRKLQQGALDKRLHLRDSEQKGSEKILDKVRERAKEESRRDEDREEKKGKSEEPQGKSEQKEGHKRVVSKEEIKRDSSGSGGGKEEGGAFSFRRKETQKSEKLGNLTETGLERQKESFLKAFKEKLAQNAENFPKKLDQETLNHLVRHIRLWRRGTGEAEIELELNAKIFKGLRLRLKSQHGKIDLHFLTRGEAVKDLFEREKGRIIDSLRDKGIDVATLTVT